MRPGNQNNKRMRGRGRKGPNPLSRSYESNGPDVKIRGTALHIAEKYQQLARDAQASGDRIMSENYFQHAEHYLRIVAAAQAHMQPAAQVPRQDGEEAPAENAAQAAGSDDRGDRRERGERGERSERKDRAERAPAAAGNMVGEDSPQPFIEDMPVIDAGGQVNGHAADAAAASSEEDEEAKPRRRTRGTRGRPPKRAAAEAGEETPATNGDASAAPSADEQEAPKPKPRRATRARKPKPVEETADTEAAPAGE